ncbi:MAG: N-acetylmuramoyl-L-alanine amidase [Alphaproteobacteria bacterium]|nr:N-acetylmuramoyl-L-alanine amidase [Alphaproteobacteria bacterium]
MRVFFHQALDAVKAIDDDAVATFGGIFQTNLHTAISWHSGAELNPHSIGIALQGNFQEDVPPEPQLEATKWLIGQLRLVLPDGIRVVPHRATYATACPGNTYEQWFGKLL